MEKTYHVYLMADMPFGTLYLGVTSNLARRAYEHKTGVFDGFSKKYGTTQLVWYEAYPTALEAITAEKKYKKWRRQWKKDLVAGFNPQWRDLANELA
jgi:putative endonuclease